MQQFTVPQFIDVEDKIIGPLTTRQFLILLLGAILIGLSYKFLKFTWFLGAGLTVFLISGIFAFLKINGMPFHFFVLNFVQTSKKPKKRIWNQRDKKMHDGEIKVKKEEREIFPKKRVVPTSRLTELSLMVDTRGAFHGEKNETENIN